MILAMPGIANDLSGQGQCVWCQESPNTTGQCYDCGAFVHHFCSCGCHPIMEDIETHCCPDHVAAFVEENVVKGLSKNELIGVLKKLKLSHNGTEMQLQVRIVKDLQGKPTSPHR